MQPQTILLCASIVGLIGLGDVDPSHGEFQGVAADTEPRLSLQPLGVGLGPVEQAAIDVSGVSPREACRLLADKDADWSEEQLGNLKSKCRKARDAIAPSGPTCAFLPLFTVIHCIT